MENVTTIRKNDNDNQNTTSNALADGQLRVYQAQAVIGLMAEHVSLDTKQGGALLAQLQAVSTLLDLAADELDKVERGVREGGRR